MTMPLVFQDGPWRMAMGLHALDPASWLVFDEHAAAEQALKRQLMAERADEVHALLPGGRAAARELLELLLRHLPVHHPDRFLAEGEAVRELATGRLVDPAASLPLAAAGLLVQEDFCLLGPGPSGTYLLEGAHLCFPMRWRLAEKLGRPLAAIHAPVAGFAERLAQPVDRFFAAFEVDRPVWRANWSLTDDPALFQPEGRAKTILPDPAEVAGTLHLRVERQTLRRLPSSRRVVFTIRTFVRPLADLAGQPEVAAALAARLREMPEPMLAYKNLLQLRPAVLAWLDREATRPARPAAVGEA